MKTETLHINERELNFATYQQAYLNGVFHLSFFLKQIGIFWLKSAIMNFRRFPPALNSNFF